MAGLKEQWNSMHYQFIVSQHQIHPSLCYEAEPINKGTFSSWLNDVRFY